jgi:hypothetical protein
MVVDPSRTGCLTAVDCCVIARAAPLNQSDIVFIFSIRLEPTNLARIWLVPNARHVCELSHSSCFRDIGSLVAIGGIADMAVTSADFRV